MKKNNKGFFLAETIVVISLVTTVMAFVFPNVSKLNDNFLNRSKRYDQTEDLYALRAVDEIIKGNCNNNNVYKSLYIDEDNNDLKIVKIDEIGDLKIADLKIGDLNTIYLAKYDDTPSSNDNYNFNKYLKRMKKTSYDPYAYRLIGVFKSDEDNERYASIKVYCSENNGDNNE